MHDSLPLADVPVLATRLDPDTALDLFSDDSPAGLFALRRLANAARVARHGYRASFVDNLQITNNTIVDTNLYGWYPAVITYRVNGVDYPDGAAFPQLFSNLTIRDNTF